MKHRSLAVLAMAFFFSTAYVSNVKAEDAKPGATPGKPEQGGPGGGGPGGPPGQGGPGGGPGGRPGGGQGGPGMQQGGQPGGVHLVPRFAEEALKLTDDQKKQIADLEKDMKDKLAKILSPEQMKTLEEARPMRGGQGGPQGGPGGGKGGPGGGQGGPQGAPGGGKGAPGGDTQGRPQRPAAN